MALGERLIGSEKKKVQGYIDIEEFSFGELDDLQVIRLWMNKADIFR